jgi:hypothetical protein
MRLPLSPSVLIAVAMTYSPSIFDANHSLLALGHRPVSGVREAVQAHGSLEFFAAHASLYCNAQLDGRFPGLY